MKKYLVVLLASWLANCAGSATADEVALAEFEIDINHSVNFFTTQEFDLDVILGDQFFNPSNPVTLFDDLLITPSDAGGVFEILVGDPALDAAQQRLTDANDEFIRIILAENQSGGRIEQRGGSESQYSANLPGAIVERIQLFVDTFNLSGGTTGGAPALSTGPPVDLTVTISIFGQQVPEPSSLWLLATSIVTLRGTLQRRLGRQ